MTCQKRKMIEIFQIHKIVELKPKSKMKPDLAESARLNESGVCGSCSPVQSCSATPRPLVRRRRTARAVELWLQQKTYDQRISALRVNEKSVSARIQARQCAPSWPRTKSSTSLGSGINKFNRDTVLLLPRVTAGWIESSNSISLAPSNELEGRDASCSGQLMC